MKEQLIPYYNVRLKNRIDTIVIHAAAQTEASDLIDLLEERELSCHYVVDREGEVFKLVDEKHRAWHAGAGVWRGESDINSNSIGIELCNGLFGEEPYTQKQMEALKELCLDLMERYDIKPINVIGHSDMAPTRKIDPGTMFPWQEFAKSGIGIWYKSKVLYDAQGIDVKQMLENIGYGVENYEATKWAFLRHYSPELYYYLGGKKGANGPDKMPVNLEENKVFCAILKAVNDEFNKYNANKTKLAIIKGDFEL